MQDLSGQQIAFRRKMMHLSQRKAASMIERKYGVKLSHSYLSLIESGSVKSIGDDLRTALADFFGLGSCEYEHTSDSGHETKMPAAAQENFFTVHRIPLYEGRSLKSYLDLTGPELADFAVKATEDMPEIGVFSGDILVCRKEKAVNGNLIAIKDTRGFNFSFARGCDHQEDMGTVVLILKKSVRAEHHETIIAAAASIMEEKLLVKELARRAGIRQVDLVRSLKVLKLYNSKSGSLDLNDGKDQ
ncbi:MAG: hypothetical protein ACOY30_15255 [Bacillota bacterium]